MNSYQMVLHRPVETARLFGKFTKRRDSGGICGIAFWSFDEDHCLSDMDGGGVPVSQWVGLSVMVSLSSPPSMSWSWVNQERV